MASGALSPPPPLQTVMEGNVKRLRLPAVARPCPLGGNVALTIELQGPALPGMGLGDDLATIWIFQPAHVARAISPLKTPKLPLFRLFSGTWKVSKIRHFPKPFSHGEQPLGGLEPRPPLAQCLLQGKDTVITQGCFRLSRK